MTIDEAIAHAREVAKEKRNEHYTFGIQKSKEVAEEYKQLVEWLEELKAIKSDGFTDDLLNMGFTKGYSKAETDYHAQSEKDRQSSYDCGYEVGYGKAIDDLISKCENAKFAESDEVVLSDIHTGTNSGLSMAIHFAEQLKAGVSNENS